MSDTATAGSGNATEGDLKKVRKEVADLEAREARERKEAWDLVERIRASGGDPFGAEAFQQVDDAFKIADNTAEELNGQNGARQRLTRITELVGVPGHGPAGGDGAASPASPDSHVHSWGDRLIGSDAYQQLVRSGVLDKKHGNVSMQPVDVASRDELRGALFQAQTIGSHGPLVPPDQQFTPPVLTPQREIEVLDLITAGFTDSDTVEYTEETSRTAAAGGVAFGTNLPEFDITWQLVTVSVRRRGVEHTATRGNLADQGQLRTILETLLDEDVRLEAEDQVVNGDGTGENFTGIYNTAGIGSVSGNTGEAYTDALHRGLTVVRLNRRMEPTGLLIHPNDHETVILDKDGNGAYRMGSATQSDRRTIWGKTAIPSTVATEELPVWGRWRDALMWQREGLTVSAYEQHEDYASRGLVLLAAEHRAAFRVRRPTAFCTVDFSTI